MPERAAETSTPRKHHWEKILPGSESWESNARIFVDRSGEPPTVREVDADGKETERRATTEEILLAGSINTETAPESFRDLSYPLNEGSTTHGSENSTETTSQSEFVQDDQINNVPYKINEDGTVTIKNRAGELILLRHGGFDRSITGKKTWPRWSTDKKQFLNEEEFSARADTTSETEPPEEQSGMDSTELEQVKKKLKETEQELEKAKKDLQAALETKDPKDDKKALDQVKKLQAEIATLKKELTLKPKEVIKEIPKEWAGATLDEWTSGPKQLEADLGARLRAGLRARYNSQVSEAEKLNYAKMLYKIDQAEKQKPFGWKMGLGALLGGVALSSLAFPIAGMFGIAGLSGLAWRGITSVATAFAVGGLTTRRLEKRNFRNAGTWGLISGILAGLGSFIGGEYLSSILGGTGVSTNGDLTVGTQNVPVAPPAYIPPTNVNPDNPLGIHNI